MFSTVLCTSAQDLTLGYLGMRTDGAKWRYDLPEPLLDYRQHLVITQTHMYGIVILLVYIYNVCIGKDSYNTEVIIITSMT